MEVQTKGERVMLPHTKVAQVDMAGYDSKVKYKLCKGKPSANFRIGDEEGWTPVIRKCNWWKKALHNRNLIRDTSQVMKN